MPCLKYYEDLAASVSDPRSRTLAGFVLREAVDPLLENLASKLMKGQLKAHYAWAVDDAERAVEDLLSDVYEHVLESCGVYDAEGNSDEALTDRIIDVVNLAFLSVQLSTIVEQSLVEAVLRSGHAKIPSLEYVIELLGGELLSIYEEATTAAWSAADVSLAHITDEVIRRRRLPRSQVDSANLAVRAAFLKRRMASLQDSLGKSI